MRRLTLLAAALPLAMLCSAHAAQPSGVDVAAYAARTLETNCKPDAPGMAVLLARGDEVLYRGACGSASLELDVPLSPGHVFKIASVTKQFAAVGVLLLVDAGKVSLDDPVSKYVPDYPNGEAITVEMLLNHTSGIRSYTDIPERIDDRVARDLTTQQMIDGFKDETPEFAPGQGWRYNNSGYVLAGAVIEAASGQSWHAYLQQALFTPLGMAQTRYGSAVDGFIPGHVDGYSPKHDSWAPSRPISMSQAHAAGALVSSVDDLLKWNRALHEGKVLKPETYARMIVPVGKAVESGYGYGIGVSTLRGEPMLQHSGGVFGFSSYLLYLPDSDITAAVLYNADGDRPGALGTRRMANLLAAHAIGKPYPEKTAIVVDAPMLAQYEGVYRMGPDAARVLRVIDGHLTSQRTGGQPFALIPVAKDTFVFEEGWSRIVFERGNDETVTAMRFFQEDEGEGEHVARSSEPLPSARTAIDLPRAGLERLVGEYVYQGVTMTVLLDGDTPRVQLTGQPAFEIFAESPSVFFLKVVEATLTFSPESGTPDTVTLRQGGAVIDYERKP